MWLLKAEKRRLADDCKWEFSEKRFIDRSVNSWMALQLKENLWGHNKRFRCLFVRRCFPVEATFYCLAQAMDFNGWDFLLKILSMFFIIFICFGQVTFRWYFVVAMVLRMDWLNGWCFIFFGSWVCNFSAPLTDFSYWRKGARTSSIHPHSSYRYSQYQTRLWSVLVSDKKSLSVNMAQSVLIVTASQL